MMKTILISAGCVVAVTGCEAAKEVLDKAKNHVAICQPHDVPAKRVSGSLKVEVGKKRFRVAVDPKAKLALGPLVERLDQPIACGRRGRSVDFSVLLHRKGKPAMTLNAIGLEWKRNRALPDSAITGNVLMPGEDKPKKFHLMSGSFGVDASGGVVKLDFNAYSALIPFPGDKHSMSITGKIEIEFGTRGDSS